jgi:hypothetical protein
LSKVSPKGTGKYQLRLKREMDGLRDELFAREEEEAIIVDDVHVVTDGENSQTGSEAKKAWDTRAKHLKQVRQGRGGRFRAVWRRGLSGEERLPGSLKPTGRNPG